ncbi:hypothetical protein QC761_706180 [Podospora bellae-mahoneyi]|uniref:Uncharacterized protein n=1 Tax=Podospora bellae-mahoneyi TaxID=2093777 RepID=A0ABR0F827_9PEZI|nr:hypothetical protein QC761_706180 [Podospora bellae-mahoneyi]
MAQPDFAYRSSAAVSNDRWLQSRSPIYSDQYHNGRFETGSNPYLPQSVTYTHGNSSSYHLPANLSLGNVSQIGRAAAESPFAPATAFNPRMTQPPSQYSSPAPPSQVSYKGVNGMNSMNGMNGMNGMNSQPWDHQRQYQGAPPQHQPPPQGPYQGRYSPSGSMDDLMTSPNMSDYSLENSAIGMSQPGNKNKLNGKPRSQRRPSNRDEFDGPHQFLKRPPPEYIAMSERDLPTLPTHLLVQEQDSVLTQVNDRLSQCAYDFVAKYQFPIPLTQDMRPVERPQDREWTEWVYLLKRLATKRRIPARVLYNGQIKQFVTILENSLEMRHAAKHQSRPLKDDRNILQLISAGIQVAKILKDAQAMDYLDRLYVSTEQQIQERAAAAAAGRFR